MDYYTTVESASSTLGKRKEIKSKVEKYWTTVCGSFPKTIPSVSSYGVFARQIATFRFEDAMFVLLCEKAGLIPSWMPYSDDVFVSVSPLKRSYIGPLCIERYTKSGLPITVRKRIASADLCERRKLSEIVVSTGELLPRWHHERLRRAYPEALVLDECHFKESFKGLPISTRYELFLSLFVSHMVLFEDYHGGESGTELDGFTSRVFEPAFKKAYELFGVEPLIVPVPWKPEFAYYPEGDHATTWRESPLLLK